VVIRVLLAVVLLSAGGTSLEGGTQSCTTAEQIAGVCGNQVVLVGEETFPGTPRTPRQEPVRPNFAPRNPQDPQCLRPQPNRPRSCFQVRAGGEAAGSPEIPTVTVRDIATFVPTPGRQQMEPDGWAVAGLDTNFYALTDPHVVNGTLLGRSADVRFTPMSYHWAYGDGTAATKATKGGTWRALGIAEFDPTPTSHVYERLGDYTITLSIVFAAEYRFAGGPWRPVVGTITLPANDLHLRVGSAKTVLVEHDCLAAPTGPGC